MAKIQKKSKQQFHLIPFFYFPPKDCPSGSHQTIFPQKPTQPNHLCASVKSVGGSSTPEASVYSVKSVGEYPPPEASVYSVQSVGGLAQANLEWVLWKKFGGLRGYGRDAIPSYRLPFIYKYLLIILVILHVLLLFHFPIIYSSRFR